MVFRIGYHPGNSNVSLYILLLLAGSDARGDIVGIG